MRRPRALVATGVTIAVVAAVVAAAAVDAWREATAQGWLADGFVRLVEDRFWWSFDRTVPWGLGALALVLLVGALWRRAMPSARELALPLAILASVGAVRALAWVRIESGPGRPNLLLISIDTLRADRLGAYGYPRGTSPVLDRRLATAGVVFEHVWSQSPKTTPSHMTMLTSLYPSVHGVSLWEHDAAPVLSPRVHTLAEVLKNAGYATAAFTAGAHMHRARGFVQGFDVYKHGDQLARARDWLDANHRHAFFLFFHTYAVHDPYTPPPDVAARFAADPVDTIAAAAARVRSGVAGWERAHALFWEAVDPDSPRDVRYVSDLYDAAIQVMDETVLGPLLDRLDALGIADDTLVVFTSDHGEAFQEHGTFMHEDLHAETLRVPLVVRFPGRLPPGRVETPVRLLDVMPTILDLLGVPIPSQAEGTSAAGLARGDEARPTTTPVISEYADPTGQWRLESVRARGRTLLRDGANVHLYAPDDPGEERDLAPAYPAAVEELAAVLDRWRADCAPRALALGPRRGDAVAPDAETVRQLRALGYVD